MNKNEPTKAGFYWALWLTAAQGTHEGDQLTPSNDFEVVKVWENFRGEPCEADVSEKFGVSVPGVRESQWLENFKWGPIVSADLRKPLADLLDIVESIGSHGPCRNLGCSDCKAVRRRAADALSAQEKPVTRAR